jgi:diguanylate cyclase (GGDEF)-like protein
MVLVPEDDREFVKAQAGLCNAHHLTQTCEHRVLRADGEQRWIQWTDHAILDEQGALIEIQSVGRDVTENRQAEAALRALATTDELTGLANRRHFLARLVEEQARLQRQETQRAVVLMLDLDHFKTINDTFGHAAGDAVLRHGAALMRDSLRIIDQVGRIGGEEFAILLSGADRAAAQVFAERLREKFAKTPVLYEGQSIPVSVSIGITALTAQEATVNAVLRRADAALYRAKAEGRNRVVMANDSSP